MDKNLNFKIKKKRNYLRDVILVVIALVVVIVFLKSKSELSFNPDDLRQANSSDARLVFNGPLSIKELGLNAQDLKPIDRFIKGNAKHFKQVRVHVERQDSYGKLKDSSELRFFLVLKFNDNSEMKSVYTRSNLKGLSRKIAWRMKEDMSKYFTLKRENRDKNVSGVTNTN